MKTLLMGVCVLALGAGVLAGCTERSDRVGGNDRDRTTSPSASPGVRPGDSTTTTTPPPSSSSPSSPSSSPSSPDTTRTTK